MFDIGFFELVLISIIGLVVLGPERLPVAIRTIRDWINGMKRFSNSIKAELTEELNIQDLAADLKIPEELNLQSFAPEVTDSIKTLQDAAKSVYQPSNKEMDN
ncbi:MAG: sec-independent protein translocase protein TatB [Colwellia sp.]|jgi:sec-independent protein translocase protein TatB|tara:strand:- start:1061 stop:1369 length:309 start_codon:yes stop_codon:yes gene_type:complete